MLGTDYLFEHILSEKIQLNFELYKSELQRQEVNALFGFFGDGTIPFPRSWKEIMEYKPETRSAEQITDHIMTKLHTLGE